MGELVISSRDLRHQMKDSRRNFKKSFKEILTRDQLENLRKFRDRRERRRGSRDFGDRRERRHGPQKRRGAPQGF